MSDMDDGMFLYDDEGEENPYIGWDLWDAEAFSDDPYEQIERDVMDSLGIESFESIFLDADSREIENARGNRFESLTEAIIYLFDAGILQFSGVVIGAEELEVEIESDTGRGGKGGGK